MDNKELSYTHIDLAYGKVIVLGNGKTRGVFRDSVAKLKLPSKISDGLELLMRGLYEETGEIQTLTIFNDGELNLSKATDG